MMDESHKEREHFFNAAKLVAGITILSRVLGLIRDMVIVPLGSPIIADRFWTAFSVPNLFRRLFGEGALSAAFVPVFTEVAESEGWQRARVLLANVAGLLAIMLAAIVILIELGLLGAWLILGGDWARMLLFQLTALMLPFMFTVCMLALGSAGLNCKGHFAYPAAAPIVLNVGLIITAYFLAPLLGKTEAQQFYIIAIGLIATGIIQLIGVIWLLGRMKLAAIPKIKPVLPESKRIAKLMGPMIIPLSVMQFSAFADRLIALIFTAGDNYPNLPLVDGVVRCLYTANRLYQLPLGVMAISIATAVFPLLSRYAARNDLAGLRETTNRALRLCIFLSLPAGIALMILAKPVISLLFERRDFSAFDTGRSAFILQMYCLGMMAYFCNHVLLRAFFSRKDTRTPLILACILGVLNIVLVIAGIFTPLKSGAIGLATAITATLNTIVLVIVLRMRIGRFGGRDILLSIIRGIVACAFMAAVIWFLLDLLDGKSDLIVICACVPAGAAAFLLSAFILRAPELREFVGSLKQSRNEKS